MSATILFLIVVGLTLVLIAPTQSQLEVTLITQQAPFSPLEKAIDENYLQQEQLSPKEIEERILFFQSVIEKQPTHFDSLVALSFLYGAENNKKMSQEMWSRAEKLDPNNPLFSK